MARADATWTNTVKEDWESGDLVRTDKLLAQVLQNVEHIAQTHDHGALDTITVGATVSNANQDNASMNPGSVSVAHTLDAGTTMMLIILHVTDNKDVATVTWGGTGTVTLFTNYYPNLAGVRRIIVYYVPSPGGSGNVDVTMASGINGRFACTVMNLIGAKTLNAAVTALESGSTTSFTSPSASGDLLIDAVFHYAAGDIYKNAAQTLILKSVVAGVARYGMSSKAVVGSTTMAWTGDFAGVWATVVIPAMAGTSDAPGGPLVLNEIEEIMLRM